MLNFNFFLVKPYISWTKWRIRLYLDRRQLDQGKCKRFGLCDNILSLYPAIPSIRQAGPQEAHHSFPAKHFKNQFIRIRHTVVNISKTIFCLSSNRINSAIYQSQMSLSQKSEPQTIKSLSSCYCCRPVMTDKVFKSDGWKLKCDPPSSLSVICYWI